MDMLGLLVITWGLLLIFKWKNVNFEIFSAGFTIFVIGLSKKVLLADPLSGIVNEGFELADQLSLASAWIVIIGYSLQLYFDFSGYSDMAIGLAGMLGYKFPVNFNSPYKSHNIVEFWKNIWACFIWHTKENGSYFLTFFENKFTFIEC